jgi:hypothetical protein
MSDGQSKEDVKEVDREFERTKRDILSGERAKRRMRELDRKFSKSSSRKSSR